MANDYIEPSKAIELIPHGFAANDGLGIDLRNGTIIIENNFKLLVFYLTGGEKESGVLDKPIPVTRGGTGATTVAGTLKNLGLTIDPNGSITNAQGSVEVYDDKFTVYGKSSNLMAFSKIATGHYRLEGTIKWGKTFKTVFPKDEYDNILCGVEIIPIASGIDIKTYSVFAMPTGENTQIGVGFKWGINIENPIDIPTDRFILFNLILE